MINDTILDVTEQIRTVCRPIEIILISNKINTKDELTSFKLCVIVNDVPSVAELEGTLYMNVDCEIPFDLLVYNFSEWERLTSVTDTFAFKVKNAGVVLYEQGK